MVHKIEGGSPLRVSYVEVDIDSVNQIHSKLADVNVLLLPDEKNKKETRFSELDSVLSKISENMGANSILIVCGNAFDLMFVHASLSKQLKYQGWFAIKRNAIVEDGSETIPSSHFGALIHSKYDAALKHQKTRIKYSYCPTCKRTTKDYGGKKHTYHEYGTLMSDVWTDVSFDYSGDIRSLIQRFNDIFSIDEYSTLNVFDLRKCELNRTLLPVNDFSNYKKDVKVEINRIIHGDCIEELRKMPSDSVDFIFVDPPYNLNKKYNDYQDDLHISDYFLWCDEWLTELARILKPGCSLTLLNIPLWSIRHYQHLSQILSPQKIIIWDAISFPVRMIMPSNYMILCFSKGAPRNLPLEAPTNGVNLSDGKAYFKVLEPLKRDFCLRASCAQKRSEEGVEDHESLSDIWGDIPRLKHNSRRVDHPTQLPPQLLYRLISIFTRKNEIVLDCFNGAGTTTLAASQLNRKFIGIEISQAYCDLARKRHQEIEAGLDPFRKEDRVLISKNSPVKRLEEKKYEVSKKELQMEIKRIYQKLGRMPTKEDVRKHSKYDFKYYEEYFSSWGEACAAARTTGMTEYEK